tara:strand:+ start:557 stop:766 length:210 start_codon:yes stop_codon:yes gene_type:complete
MTTKKVNGQSVELTAEELTEHEASQAAAQANDEADKVVKIAREEKVASTKAKLEALGLTADEIKATFNL